MRTPRENQNGYDSFSPLEHAAQLEGELLLVHGTGDDNVHFQNSVQMVSALQEAKRWLRSYTDESGQQPFRHPAYWAAFVLIGEP